MISKQIVSGSASTWCSTFNSVIKGFGWTQTADTGQSATIGGFNVFAMADTLTALLLKVTYHSNAIDVQVGQTTNGAGTFTGPGTSFVIPLASSYVGGSFSTCYFSGGIDYFVCNLFDSAEAGSSITFGVERTLSSAGVKTADGAIVISTSPTLSTCQTIPFDGTLTYTPNLMWPAALNQIRPSMSDATRSGFAFPVPFNLRPYPHGLNFLIYQGTDFVEYQTYPNMSIYGVTHTYFGLSNSSPSPCVPDFGSHALMRYE